MVIHTMTHYNLALLIAEADRAVSSTGVVFVKNAEGRSVRMEDPRPFPLMDAILDFSDITRWNLFNFSDIAENKFFADNGAVDPALTKDFLSNRTIAWVNKGVTCIDLYDAEGVKMPWATDTVGPFSYNPAAKIAKRLSALAWQTDLFQIGMPVRFINDDEHVEHDPDVLTILLTDEEDVVADGISYMRPSVRDEMIDHALDHNKDHYRKSVNFNMRLITPEGLIKGNALVSRRDEDLPADIVTSKKHNLKGELWSNNDLAYLVMYPEHENKFGRVYLDRQTRLHFYDWLIDYDMIADSFRSWLTKTINELRCGDVPGWAADFRRGLQAVEEGTVASYNLRFMQWKDSGISTLNSPGMLLALARNAEMMLAPPSRRMDGLKFPIDYATRVLLRSEYDCKMAGYKVRNLRAGEIYMHPRVGLIVADVDYERVAGILGGADKDDHVVVHFRRDSLTFEMVGVCIRNPIGGAFDSNGTRASEYWVAKIVNGARYFADHYGENAVPPVIDLAKGPMMIDDGVYPEDGIFEPVGLKVDAYTPELVMMLIEGSASAMRVYGTHANLVAFAVGHNIPLAFYGHEELFVDVCQQVPVPEDVETIAGLNEAHARQIVLYLNNHAPLADEYDFLRVEKTLLSAAKDLGLPDPKTIDGPTVRLARLHKMGMKYFRDEITKLVDHVVKSHKTIPYVPTTVYAFNSSKPFIYGLIDQKVKDMQSATGVEFDVIGNEIAAELDGREYEEIMMLFRESLSFIYHKAIRPNPRAEHINRIFSRTDSGMLSGRLLGYYLDYLAVENIFA